jgi:hypothetical protein
MIRKNQSLRMIKFIDYIYVNFYVVNSLKNYNYYNKETMNEWKIFSTHSNKCIEHQNILYLIKLLSSQKEFHYDIILICIHVYIKICEKYAHLIDNYTYLFGSVYISINKFLCDEFLCDNFLSNIFGIDLKIINNMVKCVDRFVDCNEIYFGIEEKIKIINGIYYS